MAQSTTTDERSQVASADATGPVRLDEPRWHATIAVLAALWLYVTLPPKLTFGPVWVAPVLVGVILVTLSIIAPRSHEHSKALRAESLALIIILNLFNVASVVLLIQDILFLPHGHTAPKASELFISGAQIWATNIIVFGLWFWLVDGGGPAVRAEAPSAMEFRRADFLFPQMALGRTNLACFESTWKPHLADYMYIALTNALAFSPADSMPLSRIAKVLMGIETLISFTTIALVFSRAIGVIQ